MVNTENDRYFSIECFKIFNATNEHFKHYNYIYFTVINKMLQLSKQNGM